jgi:uncharacterized membrane protein YcaP (DUF421 family)
MAAIVRRRGTPFADELCMSHFSVNWQQTFGFTVPIAETIVRGTVVYLVLFAMLVKFRRGAGTVGVGDLLLIVLLADAAQNAMSNEYKSVSDGIVLVGTLVFWNVFIDWLATKWKWLESTLNQPRCTLIRNGVLIRKSLRTAVLTESELMAHLREKGIERIDDVKLAQLEGDGKISVIPKDDSKESSKVDDDDDDRGAT